MANTKTRDGSKPRRLSRRLPLLVAASMVVLAGCEKASKTVARDPTSRGPSDVFALQYKLLRANDADGLWSLFTDPIKKECEQLLEVVRAGKFGLPENLPKFEGISARQFCVGVLVEDREAQYQTPTIRSVDSSTPGVAIVHHGKHGELTQRFREVDGQWKIDEYLRAVVGVDTEEDEVIKVKLPNGKASE